MFKCSECGCLYELKPDFCDCGNDIFTEIVESKSQAKKNISNKQNYILRNYLNKFEPVSTSIFILCLVLSVVSVFIIKPYEKVEKETKVVAKKVIHEVPDVNTFWNDTPPKNTKSMEENTEVLVQPKEKEIVIQQTVKDTPLLKNQPKKNQQKASYSKTTSKPQTPKSTVTVAKSTVSKTSTNSSTVKSPQVNNIQTNTSSGSQKTTSQATVWQPSQQTQQPVSQPVVKNQQSQTNTVAQNIQELNSYKEGLRNTIGKKIDFTKVYGSGSCVVDFKVDSSGRLIERKFSTQSSNNTLNDEVFKAVKSVSVYKAPPSSYNDQVMHLSVKFSNGYYSVSLK